MFKRLVALTALLVASLGVAAAPVASAASVKLIAAHVQSVPDAAFTKSMHLFADTVKELSNGDIEIEVHDGTLGTNETELVDKMVMGAIDITAVSPGFMSKLGVAEVDMFSLPYLIQSTDHFSKVFSGPVGERFAEVIYEKTHKEFKVLGFWSAGVRNYYGKKPVNAPTDLKGIKIRTQNAPVQLQFWKDCGAVPTSVAFAELYQALQQGVVDAAENDYLTIQQNEHHKTGSGKYISETGHDISPRLFTIRGEVWEGLGGAHREILEKASAAATDHNIKYNVEKANDSKRIIIQQGGVVNAVDIAPFVALAKKIQNDFAVRHGFQKWFEDIEAANK